MVLQWVSIITSASDRFRRDDNFVDRFHHRYTVIILVVFAVVSTTNQLVGNPITCWAPKEFESGWIKYTNQLCWVKNTYFLPFEHEIPKHDQPRDYIVYYQWIPFIFLGMAIFFYLPSVVWTSFNSKAGVDSDNILQTAETFRKTDRLDSKDRLLRLITNQIDRFVGRVPKTVGGIVVTRKGRVTTFFRKLCCLCGRRFGNYLVLLYVITKMLYIINAFCQLFVLNSVLKTDFAVYGIEAITYAMEERAFLNHTIFPKVTMCDITIRALGVDNTRTYTVQCLLPINLYTEKMFVFLWFWITLVLLLTIADLISWILRSTLARDRRAFIENSLIVTERLDRTNPDDRKLCSQFVYDYLRGDGVFVLRLIGDNTNKITSSEIIASLWDNWLDKLEMLPERGRSRSSDSDDRDLGPANNRDTLPLKSGVPSPGMKPHKPPSYRPNVGPPPPPPPKPGYPNLDHVEGAPNYPGSPPPSAPPVGPYNEYS